MIFAPFPKLARWSRDIVISEKLDGTNASVCIEFLPSEVFIGGSPLQIPDPASVLGSKLCMDRDGFMVLRAGSRTRWITPENDNAGFARWCVENSEELFKLGEGHHFGEWWGRGIQRGYDLPGKRFSLFNTGRWRDNAAEVLHPGDLEKTPAPACCDVVPVLYQGPNDERMILATLELMRRGGSTAARHYMKPEGIVIFHSASGQSFKKTLEKDEAPKGMAGRDKRDVVPALV